MDVPRRAPTRRSSAITRDDLEAYRKRVFAKDNLKVVAVGDITPEELGKLLDDVFGDLPQKAELRPGSHDQPRQGRQGKVDRRWTCRSRSPFFGLGAMPRKDPDFMTAFVLNQIVGGGGFASRLMEEVREKRGLAYSVYSYLQPFRHTSLLAGGVATQVRVDQPVLDVIRAELKKVAEEGPKPDGVRERQEAISSAPTPCASIPTPRSQASFSACIEDDFAPDYVDKRNAIISAITIDDAKRVAKRLLENDDLIVTIVGKPVIPAAQTKG